MSNVIGYAILGILDEDGTPGYGMRLGDKVLMGGYIPNIEPFATVEEAEEHLMPVDMLPEGMREVIVTIQEITGL